MQLKLSLTGLITAVYAFVLASGISSASITQSPLCMMYAAAGIITIILLYIERSVASWLLGKTITSYKLSCDTLGSECTIAAAYAGNAPGQPVFQLPSASGQMLGMAASYWTAYIAQRPSAQCKDDEDDVSCLSYIDYLRIAVLWVFVAITLVYAIRFQFVTPSQAGIGLAIGTALGNVFYRLVPQR